MNGPVVLQWTAFFSKCLSSAAVQIRIYDPSGVFPVLIKGTLTPSAALPAKTIVVTSSMVKAPAVDPVLRSWQRKVQIPGVGHELWSMLPKSALHPNTADKGQAGMTPIDGVDLAIVSSNFSWHAASLNMDLAFLLDRIHNTALRSYLKEWVFRPLISYLTRAIAAD